MSDRLTAYRAFLAAKTSLAQTIGFECNPGDVNPILKPFQRVIVAWAVSGGRRAIFTAFGLGKTMIQLETVRITIGKAGGSGLIILPLGVRQEFFRDAAMLGTPVTFIRCDDEIQGDGIYLTNYESVREGKIAPTRFTCVSLDEASCLRGFGGTKTFREFMATIAGDDKRDLSNRIVTEGVPYRFVATATPSPNEFIELLAYSAFLGVMDVGQSKTRFFKRNSEKADQLTIHAHKEEEFWKWVASWAIFVQKPSDLGFSDEGYDLPPLEVHWHEIPTDHSTAGTGLHGQALMFKDSALGVSQAAKEKRDSLDLRIEKMVELRSIDPVAHRILWHDLESEREAIERACPGVASVYGSQDLEEREKTIVGFSNGEIQELAGKPVMLGSGCNFQRHCNWAIFVGIGFKFNDFIQAVHRLHRFLQSKPVRIDLIYTEAERQVRASLERKWEQHKELVAKMTAIIQEYGLINAALANSLERSIGVDREERSGEHWKLANNDCVEETIQMEPDSVHMILTSIPFSTQYEYTPSYNDFGHTDDNDHFWQQMDFLIPELHRVLKPGRVAAIHVKDRICPGGVNGFGFQTVQPFSDECIQAFIKHGFAFLARKTIVTDVVRENSQTYRLGWTEQCKDGSRMGCGMPEYVLLFRKAPSDRSNGYADEPVVKSKEEYTRAMWQFDAHGFTRSSGNRLLMPEDLAGQPHNRVFQMFREHSRTAIYDHAHDIAIAEYLDSQGMLPPSFMLLQPVSNHPDVWTDITRMRTLNGMQHAKGKEMHLCLGRDSLVLTNTGYKPIQEVEVGDLVLTHKGRWRPVTVVRNTGTQEAVSLNAHGVSRLVLTPDHKLWTRVVRNIPWAKSHSRKDAKLRDPKWVEAKDTIGSYVNLQLPPIEPTEITDPTVWWTVGRWLADGHIDAHGGAIISCGVHEVESLSQSLGEFAGNPFHGNTSARQVLLRDPNKVLRRILDQCGRGAAGKQLPPQAYSLPVDQARALLNGYMSGDGHFRADRERFMATSVSKALLLGIAMLAQRVHNTVASLYPGREAGNAMIQGREVQTRQEWVLSFDVPSISRRKGLPFIEPDGAWKRVRSAEPVGLVETWCLRVEEDESFTAEGCIVKNCPLQFDIVDRLTTQFTMEGETVFDPFSGLGTVAYCAVKKKRKGLGCELSKPYWADSVYWLKKAEDESNIPTLFDLLGAEADAGVAA